MSDKDPKAAGTKFSQFPATSGDGIEGVGLKDGQNVRFALTTDAVQVNPNPFRNTKGQFAATPEELENLKNQRDVNEFLYDAIQKVEAGDVNLDGYATEDWVTEQIDAIPDVNLDGYATEEWVTEQIDGIDFPAGTIVSDTAPLDVEDGATWYDTVRLELFVYAEGAWLPCSPLGARVEQGEIVQAQILSRVEAGEEQQQTLIEKVNALEGAAGEHSFVFTSGNTNPRPGEFNLKDDQMQLTNMVSAATYIYLSDTDRDGNTIDFDRIAQGDVLRLSSIDGQMAEVKITNGSDGIYVIEKMGGDLDRLSELPYDFILLSSFDPAGLATIDYVDAQDDKKLNTTGGTLTGALNLKRDDDASYWNYITSDTPKAWHSSEANHGLILRVGTTNSFKQQFKIQGRSNKDLFEIHDDGKAQARIEGNLNVKNELKENGKRVATQESIADKLDKAEANEVANSFRIRGTGGTYISAAGGELGLYHVKYPEDETHAANLKYVDDETAKIKQYVDEEIGKIDGGGSEGAIARSGTDQNPTLATGELYFCTTNKTLLIGT